MNRYYEFEEPSHMSCFCLAIRRLFSKESKIRKIHKFSIKSQYHVYNTTYLPLASDSNLFSTSLCSRVTFTFIPKWPDTSLLANETQVFGLVAGGKMKFFAFILDFGMAFFNGRVLTSSNSVFNTSSAAHKENNH